MRKVYVDVKAKFSSQGELVPLSFTWENGKEYFIDKVFECKQAASLKAGGQGMRYRCRVMGKEVLMFFEDSRWFMEGKNDEL